MNGTAINRRALLRWTAVIGGGLIASACGSDKGTKKTTSGIAPNAGPAPAPRLATPEPITDPDQALTRLKDGNARFVAGSVNHPDQTMDRRTALAAGQHPFALILSCVDSRVPPELVFDQGLGDLFVSRTAGQVVDHAVRGSIEYGVLELKIPLLVVLGHEKCGAVKATVEALEKKSAPLGNDIDALVAGIRAAAEKAENEHAADPVDAAVRYNVANIVADLGKDATLAGAVTAGSLRIVGARYDLDAGAVEFL
jgi:carbonic anhydrase